MKKISTSALAKILKTESKELFNLLESHNLIIRNNDHWELTTEGTKTGAEVKDSARYGNYIVWNEDFNPYDLFHVEHSEFISVSIMAESFNVSARKMNHIISELGWIEPNIKGWKLTKFGEKIGGKQFEHKTGGTYTKWKTDILQNSSLLTSLGIKQNQKEKLKETKVEKKSDDLNFREKFPAQYRTKDGHNVRSRGELIIDNSLYEYGLAHAYERKLPIEEEVYSDFYIPAKDGGKAVYIEYWGLEDQEKYEKRKKIKKDIYAKYHLNLLELENKHIDNLEDYLPRMLLEFGIRVD